MTSKIFTPFAGTHTPSTPTASARVPAWTIQAGWTLPHVGDIDYKARIIHSHTKRSSSHRQKASLSFTLPASLIDGPTDSQSIIEPEWPSLKCHTVRPNISLLRRKVGPRGWGGHPPSNGRENGRLMRKCVKACRLAGCWFGHGCQKCWEFAWYRCCRCCCCLWSSEADGFVGRSITFDWY